MPIAFCEPALHTIMAFLILLTWQGSFLVGFIRKRELIKGQGMPFTIMILRGRKTGKHHQPLTNPWERNSSKTRNQFQFFEYSEICLFFSRATVVLYRPWILKHIPLLPYTSRTIFIQALVFFCQMLCILKIPAQRGDYWNELQELSLDRKE